MFMPVEKQFFDFLKDLAKNNSLEWFHANKKRYEAQVKEPFLALLEEIVVKAVKFEPELATTPLKSMMFRINRDIRFSKDKSPYKTYLAATIGEGGTRNKLYPATYLHLGLDQGYVCSGAYWFEDKETLTRVRRFLIKNDKRFKKLVEDKKWKAAFGGMLGHKNKRLGPEFAAAAERQPLLYNTQLYWCAEFKPKQALEKNFAGYVSEMMKTGIPLNEFLREAIYTK
jgi:uncharacterized protein (TIGR02453 family)